mmetsp:Transcript_26820/g.76980  ORF Transcript_26820/g.76980 Transcript_26820/m.76980 type:complete len:317 (-) Transcript_26820:1368-2318(-)
MEETPHPQPAHQHSSPSFDRPSHKPVRPRYVMCHVVSCGERPQPDDHPSLLLGRGQVSQEPGTGRHTTTLSPTQHLPSTQPECLAHCVGVLECVLDLLALQRHRQLSAHRPQDLLVGRAEAGAPCAVDGLYHTYHLTRRADDWCCHDLLRRREHPRALLLAAALTHLFASHLGFLLVLLGGFDDRVGEGRGGAADGCGSCRGRGGWGHVLLAHDAGIGLPLGGLLAVDVDQLFLFDDDPQALLSVDIRQLYPDEVVVLLPIPATHRREQSRQHRPPLLTIAPSAARHGVRRRHVVRLVKPGLVLGLQLLEGGRDEI